jgi:hypothetical protein
VAEAGATARRELRSAARAAGDSAILTALARVGFGASALVQVLLGGLAIQLGVNHVGEADQTGALQQIAKVPGGFVVLWISVIGLLSLALWLVIQAGVVFRASSRKTWAKRIEYLGKAVAYVALGLSAFAFAVGGEAHAGDTARRASADILSLPAGPVLLAVLGLATAAIGASFMTKGVRQTFTTDIELPSGRRGRLTLLALGTAGYLAKGLVVAVAGVLFIVSAIEARADEATGVDGALEALGRFPVGAPLLFAVGAGLIASGAYNGVRAWQARF